MKGSEGVYTRRRRLQGNTRTAFKPNKTVCGKGITFILSSLKGRTITNKWNAYDSRFWTKKKKENALTIQANTEEPAACEPVGFYYWMPMKIDLCAKDSIHVPGFSGWPRWADVPEMCLTVCCLTLSPPQERSTHPLHVPQLPESELQLPPLLWLPTPEPRHPGHRTLERMRTRWKKGQDATGHWMELEQPGLLNMD